MSAGQFLKAFTIALCVGLGMPALLVSSAWVTYSGLEFAFGEARPVKATLSRIEQRLTAIEQTQDQTVDFLSDLQAEMKR